MSTKNKTELIEIKELIRDRFNDLDRKIDNQTQQLKIEFLEVKSELSQTISTNTEKINGLDKRMGNIELSVQKIPDLAEKVGEFKWWKQAVLILSSGSVGAILAKIISK